MAPPTEEKLTRGQIASRPSPTWDSPDDRQFATLDPDPDDAVARPGSRRILKRFEDIAGSGSRHKDNPLIGASQSRTAVDHFFNSDLH